MSKPLQDAEVKVGMVVFATINGAVVKAKVTRKVRLFCRMGLCYMVCPVDAGSTWTYSRRAAALSLSA